MVVLLLLEILSGPLPLGLCLLCEGSWEVVVPLGAEVLSAGVVEFVEVQTSGSSQ